MNKNKLKYLLLMFMAVFAMASCSETDEDKVEFPDWANKNNEAFNKVYAHAKQKVHEGDPNWKIICAWSFTDDYPFADDEHIVVNVLSNGDLAGDTPMYTDSVFIAYSGNLLPSTSFPNGYNFDKSYTGDFNPETVFPMGTGMTNFVDGFTTALLHMHRGDYWRVYIPSRLAYGNMLHAVIPQNSMLIFDIYLFDFMRPGSNRDDK